MAKMTMIQALNQAMGLAMAENPKVMVLGEDVGRDGGVFRATEGLYERFGAERVVDTPLAESSIIGSAVGLAIGGMRPIAEIQFLGFIYETMDQIETQASRMRFRSQSRYHVPLVIRSPYGGGVRTPEIHSDSLEALFVHTPGIKVVTPSTPYDAKGLLLAAIQDPDPVLFMEPIPLYRAMREEVPDNWYEIPLGKAQIRNPGEDITIIAWGPMVPVAEACAKQATREQISAEVIDLRTLSPLDEETVITSVEKTGRAVIVHEAVGTGGLGGEVTAIIQEHAFLSLQAPILRVTGYDTPYPVSSVEDLWRPDVARVLEAVHRSIHY
ncbi:MAG: alpha-ketoacid dehydrogenase subunit beta [Sulfobacillus benefaciens]|uniref:Alpha-ketoacid dehydrogenase subunit beta n=1 Tax=Sulfobacillus benefaciens TaxID=453960 RepID=A0A2T2X939_9FIRM|nr:MAG: alpha-ketoacid dehydrogenase subunit beta [Sulfobacillus benefaciens]